MSLTQTPTSFSKFSWAIALFCLPSTLFPLALIISPQFSHHPDLSPRQIDLFSILFWIYPAVLFGISIMLFKLRKTRPHLANKLLLVAFIGFYTLLTYIVGKL